MSIEVKISKKRVNYKKAMYILEKRVENVKKGLKKEKQHIKNQMKLKDLVL